MSARLLASSLALTALAALASCRSSGRYGTPGYAVANAGVGVVGAVASRASGRCYAQCIAGTHCNPANGLCEPGEASPVAVQAKARGGRVLVSTGASYEPGHEYEVPALAGEDAGCGPEASVHGDGGSLACEMDAAVSSY